MKYLFMFSVFAARNLTSKSILFAMWNPRSYKSKCIVEYHFMYFSSRSVFLNHGIWYRQIEARRIVRILREERSYWRRVHWTSVVTLSGGYFPSLRPHSVDKRAVTRISRWRCQHHGHMVAVSWIQNIRKQSVGNKSSRVSSIERDR